MGDPKGFIKSSEEKWFGKHTITHDGKPYMTRWWIGRLRLHFFHTGDPDRDHHDHPFDFWTFPLTPYVESVVAGFDYTDMVVRLQVVPAWCWSFRRAEHTHRVLGRYSGKAMGIHSGTVFECPPEIVNKTPAFDPQFDARRVVTIVWNRPRRRHWGFFKNRDGVWCWQYWREHYNGGRDQPCAPSNALEE
jgi:hypothetical protein